jgi:hypothetical protein
MTFSHVRTPRRKALGVVAAAAALVLATPLVAHASYSSTADTTARVGGRVLAIANTPGRTYIGGEFTAVGGQNRGGVAAIQVKPGTSSDGKLDSGFVANTDGVVNAVTVSADGGTVFLGGKFTTVNGTPRANLAAVEAATGNVLPGWSADTTGDTPEVLSLAVLGDRLFAGGRFGGIDGRTTYKRLAAIGVSSGNVIETFKPKPSLQAIKFLSADPDEGTVFVGGGFSTIGGASRGAGIAELNGSTGVATPFAPASVGSVVTAMGTSADGDELYFGVANNEVHAYSTDGSGLKLWTIKNGGDTQAIEVTGDEIFMGGHFGQNLTEKIKRQWVLSTDLAGHVTSWDAKLGGGSMGVWAIDATDQHVHIGGEFITVDGLNRPRYVRFDVTP